MFDNYEYKINPDHYVEQVNIEGHTFCYFLVGELKNTSLPTAILGDAFIRNYYILHDLENKRIGIYGGYIAYFPIESDQFFNLFVIGIWIGGIILGILLYNTTKDHILAVHKEELLNELKNLDNL